MKLCTKISHFVPFFNAFGIIDIKPIGLAPVLSIFHFRKEGINHFNQDTYPQPLLNFKMVLSKKKHYTLLSHWSKNNNTVPFISFGNRSLSDDNIFFSYFSIFRLKRWYFPSLLWWWVILFIEKESCHNDDDNAVATF